MGGHYREASVSKGHDDPRSLIGIQGLKSDFKRSMPKKQDRRDTCNRSHMQVLSAPTLTLESVCAESVGGKLARRFGVLRQTVEQSFGISSGSNSPEIDFDDEDLTLRGQQKCSALIKVILLTDFSLSEAGEEKEG
jgi:hypothetical protein